MKRLVLLVMVGCSGAPFSAGVDPPDSVGYVGQDHHSEAGSGAEAAMMADAPTYADARFDVIDSGNDSGPNDSGGSCQASPKTQPTPCFQAYVTGPTQYGYAVANKINGNTCVATAMPLECQCAGKYTCDCLMHSEFPPACPNGTPECVISYPNLGGIVVYQCNQ